jgi:TusA-related sulfurtransferase
VNTYFRKTTGTKTAETTGKKTGEDWNEVMKRFKNNFITIDVRQLEMPLPMMTILEALDKLPADHALFVYHKRIPMFLLPELAERNFDYRIKEIGEGEVHLLIFKS